MKKAFAQYRALTKEIKKLSRRISEMPCGIVTDYGIDYSTGQGRTIPLSGLADTTATEALKERLELRRERAEALVLKVEDAIAACPDARTRNVIDAYYVEGKTLKEVALEEGIHEETAREIKDRFFREMA